MDTIMEATTPSDALYVEEPDFSQHDPSLRDGYRVLYDKEVPFEMRMQENDEAPHDVGTLQAVRCKICVQGRGDVITAVKLELTSEDDLFFHYAHHVDERAFRAVREEQRLMIEFADYPNVLARSLNLAIKEPHSHLAVFIMNRDGNARLDFIQNLEYKFVELLSVSFLRCPESLTREQIVFRYASLKSKLTLVQSRLAEVTNVVKLKNPSLLLQIQGNKGNSQESSHGDSVQSKTQTQQLHNTATNPGGTMKSLYSLK